MPRSTHSRWLIVLLALAGCARTVEVRLAPGTVLELDDRTLTAGAEPLSFRLKPQAARHLRLSQPGHSALVADLTTTIEPDHDDYWGKVIYASCWNCTVETSRGQLMPGNTSTRAHPVLYAHPLERLGAPGPFALPASGQGVVLVVDDPGAYYAVDGAELTAFPPSTDPDWSMPLVVPLAPGRHQLRVQSRFDNLERPVDITAGEYVYLCAKALGRPSSGGHWLN
jgi:hypothetical protein